MRNIKNTENRRLKNSSQRATLRKNQMILILSVIMIISTFCTVGIAANAKDKEIPMYKYYQSYMVEKNDTLFSIAYAMNTEECSDKQIQECVDEMISINSLDHKGTICYGNYIIVPYYSTEYR